MIAKDHINKLQSFIDDLTKQDNEYLILQPKEYKRQLDTYFEIETEGIIKDINRDLEWLSKEDDKDLREGLKQLLPTIENLVHEVERLAISDNRDEKAEIRVAFYKRLQGFLSSLIQTVEEVEKDALTNAQINACHFECLKAGITVEHLIQIYDNLKSNHWICSRHTSMDAFIYYFTGQGFMPSKQIHWKVSTAKLALFLDEIVADDHIWAKASHIFLVKNKPVGKKSLGNIHSKSLDRPITERHLKEIKTKITHVELRPKSFWME